MIQHPFKHNDVLTHANPSLGNDVLYGQRGDDGKLDFLVDIGAIARNIHYLLTGALVSVS
jgi:hypothetical protein